MGNADEASYKLCRVKSVNVGKNSVPFLVTNDGRTIRYPNPDCKIGDTVEIELATGKIQNWVKFDSGNLCMITGGRNLGRMGTKSMVSLPKDKGVRKTIAEERDARLAAKAM